MFRYCNIKLHCQIRIDRCHLFRSSVLIASIPSSKPTIETRTAAPSKIQGRSPHAMKISPAVFDAFQDFAICAAAYRIGRKQARRASLSRFQVPCVLVQTNNTPDQQTVERALRKPIEQIIDDICRPIRRASCFRPKTAGCRRSHRPRPIPVRSACPRRRSVEDRVMHGRCSRSSFARIGSRRSK